jgi:hypothetical protein
MAENHGKPHEERLTHIESSVAAMGAKLDTVTSTLQSFSADVKNIYERISNQGRTNWSVIASLAGIAITVFLVYSGLLINPISRNVEIHDSRLFDLIEKRSADREHLVRIDERVKILLKEPRINVCE